MNGDGAECTVIQEGKVIAVQGVVDRRASRVFGALPVSVAPGDTLRMDFSGVFHVDIFGINEIVKLREQIRARGGSLRAVGVSGELMDILRSTCLHEVLRPETASGPSSYDEERVRSWARPVETIRVGDVFSGAINLNVDGRRPSGPVQGFGRLWEKTYTVKLPSERVSPQDVVAELKRNFPLLQPEQNRFYPSGRGIEPGEVVLINARTPGGPIATGVWVVYADEHSFAFMTPQGHPESGWVSFTGYEEDGFTVARITGFARASDPLYEIAFELMGSRIQERIWRHVLVSLASRVGLEAQVRLEKVCVGPNLQWKNAKNVIHNAQIHTLVWVIRRVLGRQGS